MDTIGVVAADAGRLKIKVGRHGKVTPPPPARLSRANICDRLSSATDTPRSARQKTLEQYYPTSPVLKDELLRILSVI